MREILLAYQTLIDPASRHSYDLSRSQHVPGSFVATEHSADVSPAARHDRQRYYAFPPLHAGAPAQIDLGEITYLLSSSRGKQAERAGHVARREGLRPWRGHITVIAAIITGKRPHCRRFVPVVGRAIGASTCCCAASTARLSSKASKFVTRLARCNMAAARSARLTNCSPCVPTVAKPSGAPPRRPVCGTCETGRRE